MVQPGEDDRDAVDRAFAEMIAGYHLTAEPRESVVVDQSDTATTDPSIAESPSHDTSLGDASQTETAGPRVDAPPVFRMPPIPEPVVEPEPTEPDYEPEPLPPMRRPGIPALVGWIGIAYAIVVTLAGTFGAVFPTWAGWLAVGGFIGGFGILLSRLPRHRPPDAGDGAVI